MSNPKPLVGCFTVTERSQMGESPATHMFAEVGGWEVEGGNLILYGPLDEHGRHGLPIAIFAAGTWQRVTKTTN